jgi:alpha-1,3-rhamnosyl/mannosyltransferase
VLCGSDATLKLLVTHLHIGADRVEVIPYGVADSFFASPAPDAGSGPQHHSPPYLLFVGRWEARKGLATLYAALRQVNAKRARVRLILAGQFGWGTKQLIETMGRDPSVELYERPSDEVVAELYKSALALVYPSEMEGFGLPVAEAMACGCLVIASDLPSIREFAGAYPLYITAGDSHHLARHIEQLLDGDPTAEERRQRGRDAVASLRWGALGERTAIVIEQMTGEQRSCQPVQ